MLYPSDLPAPCNLSKDSVYAIAKDIARQLDFGVGGNLEDVVTALNGKITYRNFWGRNESDSGSMDIHEDESFDIYLAQDTSMERDRFTIAHELGHFILHYVWPKKKLGKTIERLSASRYGSDRIEWEANWFAASFLMPDDKFTDIYNKYNGDISVVADKFEVSLSAARIRAEGLDLIS